MLFNLFNLFMFTAIIAAFLTFGAMLFFELYQNFSGNKFIFFRMKQSKQVGVISLIFTLLILIIYAKPILTIPELIIGVILVWLTSLKIYEFFAPTQYDGTMQIDTSTIKGNDLFNLEFNRSMENIKYQKELRFKVDPTYSSSSAKNAEKT